MFDKFVPYNLQFLQASPQPQLTQTPGARGPHLSVLGPYREKLLSKAEDGKLWCMGWWTVFVNKVLLAIQPHSFVFLVAAFAPGLSNCHLAHKV